jgi:hypothetical protein
MLFSSVLLNKLATNYGDNGITVNRFFGFGLSEDTKMAKFDDSEYDTIVFDEIVFFIILLS